MSSPTEKRDASANPIELKDVYPALYDATEKWIDIGLQLNVKSNDLKRIETNFQHNTEKLRETLNLRINQGDLTWEHITEALENRTIGHKTLADEIRSKYITPQPTTTTPVKRANSTQVMAPVTSTLNTATGLTMGTDTTTTTLGTDTTTVITTPITRQLSMNSKQQPTTLIAANTPQACIAANTPQACIASNTLQACIASNTPQACIASNTPEASTQERGHSSTAKKRPSNSTSPEGVEGSKRSKTAEYYDEGMFANKTILTKYQCIHCKKIPTRFFRCNCGKTDKQELVGKGKARFEGNTGLSCSDCTHQACTSCRQSDQYKSDKATNNNIRMLKVFCENKCGESFPLYKREGHVCSIRKRTCKYAWAGCKNEGAGDEIEQHEKEVDVHVLAAIDKLHEENLESNSDLKKCVESIEAKLNAIYKALQPQLP